MKSLNRWVISTSTLFVSMAAQCTARLLTEQCVGECLYCVLTVRAHKQAILRHLEGVPRHCRVRSLCTTLIILNWSLAFFVGPHNCSWIVEVTQQNTNSRKEWNDELTAAPLCPQCNEPWMKDKCNISCGRCGKAPCTDVPPPSAMNYTCHQQATIFRHVSP